MKRGRYVNQDLLQAQDLSNGNIGRKATSRLAAKILREYKQRFNVIKPPYDPKLQADVLGIKVKNTKSLLESSGKFLLVGDTASILLSQKDTDNRQRFSCAHELGHAILRGYYSHQAALIYLDTEHSMEEEIRANIFARSFLMPEREILTSLQEQDPTIGAEKAIINLSRRFAVNPLAIVYRLTDIELPTRHWFFLILKYMVHPDNMRIGGKGPRPKLRVLQSATPKGIYIPKNQGADSIGLSISDLTEEQVKQFRRRVFQETVCARMIQDDKKWKDSKINCQAIYRRASSPTIKSVILGLFTIVDVPR